MVHRGLNSFQDKKIVFLQGPVGPFFHNLGLDLERIGATVYKINFNGGDWLFSSGKNSINYRGNIQEWPDFFTAFIEQNHIDTVILFGDCREYHRLAHTVADKMNLDIGVFEEGYVRPDYITFEEFGVNGHSQLSRDPNFYLSLPAEEYSRDQAELVGNTFWYAAWYAFLYYLMSALAYPFFHRYKHHRSLSPWEITFWIRSIWRKQYYRFKERDILDSLTKRYSKKFYLVPLQISTDAQVKEHSGFSSVENFIERVIGSFSVYAPAETILVIKHHPMDRGYHDYERLIDRLCEHFGIQKRVMYIHDLHLPTLLTHTCGVVMINSTVGLSAIHHKAPLKACGTAIYDFEGLSYQGSIEHFWKDSENFQCDYDLYERFRGYIVKNKQINGSFYRKLPNSNLNSGVLW